MTAYNYEKSCGSARHFEKGVPATTIGLGCIPVCAECKAAQAGIIGRPYPSPKRPAGEPRYDDSWVAEENARHAR